LIISAAKVRISEEKTKFYLSFFECEYLRAKLKVGANRAKYIIIVAEFTKIVAEFTKIALKRIFCLVV